MNMCDHAATILVVDDEPIVRDLAERVLQLNGYHVLIAENGQAAISIASRHPEVRAVLLDLGMPVMGGDAAAPILRAKRPDLALILSSGYAEHEARVRFGNGPLAGFLQKPYDPSTLLAKVAEALTRPGAPVCVCTRCD